MHALRDSLQVEARKQDVSVDIYCCQSYEGTKTYDGVDVCADRAVREIKQHVAELEQDGHQVEKFSILGLVHHTMFHLLLVQLSQRLSVTL